MQMFLYIDVTKIQSAPQSDFPHRQIEDVSTLMRVLSHPQRMCLLCHLVSGPRTVTELVELCQLPQPQVSQFLARMKQDKLIDSTRQGRTMVYAIVDMRAIQVMKALSDIFCSSTSDKKGNVK